MILQGKSTPGDLLSSVLPETANQCTELMKVTEDPAVMIQEAKSLAWSDETQFENPAFAAI